VVVVVFTTTTTSSCGCFSRSCSSHHTIKCYFKLATSNFKLQTQ